MVNNQTWSERRTCEEDAVASRERLRGPRLPAILPEPESCVAASWSDPTFPYRRRDYMSSSIAHRCGHHSSEHALLSRPSCHSAPWSSLTNRVRLNPTHSSDVTPSPVALFLYPRRLYDRLPRAGRPRSSLPGFSLRTLGSACPLAACPPNRSCRARRQKRSGHPRIDF